MLVKNGSVNEQIVNSTIRQIIQATKVIVIAMIKL